MPVQISGSEYLTSNDVCERVGISRQTLWRWRQEDKVPAGKRLRGRQLVFSRDEVAEIEQYATHLEPADTASTSQLALFSRHAAARD